MIVSIGLDHRHGRGARADGGRRGGAARHRRPGRGPDSRRRAAQGPRVIVTLLTDYGRDDDFVGVCHGVIRGIHPRPRSSTSRTGSSATRSVRARWCCATRCRTCRSGCTWRWWTRRWAPSGARSRCARATGASSSGPDNGLLSLAWERCEGVELAVDVTRSPHRPRAGVGHLPRPRHLRAGGRAARGGRRARRRGRPARPRRLARGAARAARRGRARWWRTRS